MGASFSVSDAAFLLKEYYNSDLQIAADLMYGQDAHVLFHRLPKNTKIFGKIVPIPVRYAPVAGRSATAAIAAQNAQTLQGSAFQMAIKTDYDFAYIDGRTLNAMNLQELLQFPPRLMVHPQLQPAGPLQIS